MEKYNSRTLTIIVSLVMLLWVISVIIPRFIFRDLNEAAMYGDSFGSVNALFSALTVAGLIYTLILQVQNGREQRNQEILGLYAKMVDDLRSDLDTIEYGPNSKGQYVWVSLNKYLNRESLNNNQIMNLVRPLLTSLLTANKRMIFISRRLNRKEINPSNVEFVKIKLMVVYTNYLSYVNDEIVSVKFNVEDPLWQNVRTSCDEAAEIAKKEISILAKI